MTSLYMGTLVRSGVPADESVVRNTATPVDVDGAPAEATAAPDFNEVETDSNPNLGMVSRQLASHVIPTVKYPAFWLDEVDNAHLLNDRINAQVSSSGTAAAREAAGQWGHGTMQVLEGIEPVHGLNGGAFGNDYFAANDPLIQSTAGNFMSVPPGQDYNVPGTVGYAGKDASRQAQQQSNAPLYDAFLNGGN